jgi:hypothetical protein
MKLGLNLPGATDRPVQFRDRDFTSLHRERHSAGQGSPSVRLELCMQCLSATTYGVDRQEARERVRYFRIYRLSRDDLTLAITLGLISRRQSSE